MRSGVNREPQVQRGNGLGTPDGGRCRPAGITRAEGTHWGAGHGAGAVSASGTAQGPTCRHDDIRSTPQGDAGVALTE